MTREKVRGEAGAKNKRQTVPERRTVVHCAVLLLLRLLGVAQTKWGVHGPATSAANIHSRHQTSIRTHTHTLAHSHTHTHSHTFSLTHTNTHLQQTRSKHTDNAQAGSPLRPAAPGARPRWRAGSLRGCTAPGARRSRTCRRASGGCVGCGCGGGGGGCGGGGLGGRDGDGERQTRRKTTRPNGKATAHHQAEEAPSTSTVADAYRRWTRTQHTRRHHHRHTPRRWSRNL
jgi:hypothetical protein